MNKKLLIWNRMTPEQRDYDRFVARQIPIGASMTPETEGGRLRLAERNRLDIELAAQGEYSCSCHIMPPCSFCVEGIQWRDAE